LDAQSAELNHIKHDHDVLQQTNATLLHNHGIIHVLAALTVAFSNVTCIHIIDTLNDTVESLRNELSKLQQYRYHSHSPSESVTDTREIGLYYHHR
jgi:hypothetical protein